LRGKELHFLIIDLNDGSKERKETSCRHGMRLVSL
jgi:hypothetical protein